MDSAWSLTKKVTHLSLPLSAVYVWQEMDYFYEFAALDKVTIYDHKFDAETLLGLWSTAREQLNEERASYAQSYGPAEEFNNDYDVTLQGFKEENGVSDSFEGNTSNNQSECSESRLEYSTNFGISRCISQMTQKIFGWSGSQMLTRA